MHTWTSSDVALAFSTWLGYMFMQANDRILREWTAAYDPEIRACAYDEVVRRKYLDE